MMDQFAPGPLPLDGDAQRGDRQLPTQMIAHCPTDHLAGARIEDDGEAEPAFSSWDIADLGCTKWTPQGVKPDFIRPAANVRLSRLPAIGRPWLLSVVTTRKRRCVSAPMP